MGPFSDDALGLGASTVAKQVGRPRWSCAVFAKAQGCASMVGTRFSGPLRATPKISAGDVMIIEGAGPSPAKPSFDAVAGSTSRRRFESHGWPLKRGDAYRGTDQPGRAQNGDCGCGDLGEVTSGG